MMNHLSSFDDSAGKMLSVEISIQKRGEMKCLLRQVQCAALIMGQQLKGGLAITE